MPVNTDKYYYVNRVGLLKDSWALQKFLKDAERHHMLDQPGKLVALRLTEYYEWMERMNGGVTPTPVTNGSSATAANLPPIGNVPPLAIDEDDELMTSHSETDQKDALDGIADYWKV
jgi:hypothetical protein